MKTLTKKERMCRALWRQPVDRPPVQTNYTGAMGAELASLLGCTTKQSPARRGDHLLRVDLAHTPRLSADRKVSFDWRGTGWGTETEGYWHAVAPLAHSLDLSGCACPDPGTPALLAEAERALAADRGEHFFAPNFGVALFERAWSLRGFDQLLMDMVDRPEWVEELLDRITVIQVTSASRFVALGVDGGHFGDDYGVQRGLLFSPKMWRQMIKQPLGCRKRQFSSCATGLPPA